MRFFTASVLGLLVPSLCAASNLTTPTRLPLPADFKPPQVFKNTNLVRNTNLDKGYVRETINVVVENVDKQPQSDYYIPFSSNVFDRVGGFEVRDKKAPEKGRFEVDATVADSSSGKQYFVVHLPEPLAPSSEITLGISYSLLSSAIPLPATINQMDKQYLTYSFSAYTPSAYRTDTQKTKLKFSTTNVPDYTTTSGIKSGSGADPERKGSTYTYGPYNTAKVTPGTEHPITVRYEFTKPVITASLLERDLEVSHWGGNLATEERYWLRNNGSQLAEHFSRVEWTLASYQKLPTTAVREITYPLQPGSVDPYYVDDIGNVSTSHFRPGTGKNSATLELKPRYPIFGGWNYSFHVGWNNDLSSFLRRATGADSYVLKVPFLEGPRVPEGVQYEHVVLRIVLPEGARNVQFQTVDGSASSGLPGANHIAARLSSLNKYMDTLGRTTLTLEVDSLTDEARNSQLVVTYTYSMADALRKPFTVFAGILSVFAAAWAIGRIDVSIKKR